MNFLQFLLLAQPAQTGEGGKGGGMTMFLMIGAIILVFYFFMIRPQQKKQKQITNFRDTLKRGDKIVTIGGVHGTITDVKEGTFVIEIADGVKVTIEKAAIAVDPNATAKKG